MTSFRNSVNNNNNNVIKPFINDFDLVEESLIQTKDCFDFAVPTETNYDSTDSEDSHEESVKKENDVTQQDWQLVSNQNVSSPSSSASSFTIAKNQVSSSASSYYEMLLSKITNDTSKQKQSEEEMSSNLELLKESSKGNVDWEFWASVISDFERINKTEHNKLRLMLSIGIPPTLRGKLWRIFSNSETDNDLETEYQTLLNKTSPHEKLIKRDLPRTFPNLPYFKEKDGEGQEMLFHVIKAYSLFDAHVGYCQGLHFIVGCLLLNMPDEAAFCVLLKLMGKYGLRGNFTPQMESLHERMYQFNQLLQIHLPQVHRHLEAQGILPSMYASQWFMTLFSYRCPLDLVYRVFDLVFVEGSSIIINFALALMKKNQQVILSLEFELLLEFFSGNIFETYKDKPYEFVQDAYSFDISPRVLSKLSKQYQAEAAKEAKIQSIEDNIKRENAQLDEKVKKLKGAYKTLEMEHQHVTQQVIQSKTVMAKLDLENQRLKNELFTMKQTITKINNNKQNEFEQLALQNTKLVNKNSMLEDKLSELETILIDMKLRYAESENEYEIMKHKLKEAYRLIEKNSNLKSS